MRSNTSILKLTAAYEMLTRRHSVRISRGDDVRGANEIRDGRKTDFDSAAVFIMMTP